MRGIHTHLTYTNFILLNVHLVEQATFPHPLFYTDIQVENHDNFSAGHKGGIPEEKKMRQELLDYQKGIKTKRKKSFITIMVAREALRNTIREERRPVPKEEQNSQYFTACWYWFEKVALSKIELKNKK